MAPPQQSIGTYPRVTGVCKSRELEGLVCTESMKCRRQEPKNSKHIFRFLFLRYIFILQTVCWFNQSLSSFSLQRSNSLLKHSKRGRKQTPPTFQHGPPPTSRGCVAVLPRTAFAAPQKKRRSRPLRRLVCARAYISSHFMSLQDSGLSFQPKPRSVGTDVPPPPPRPRSIPQLLAHPQTPRTLARSLARCGASPVSTTTMTSNRLCPQSQISRLQFQHSPLDPEPPP